LTPVSAPEGYKQLERFHSEVAELTPEIVQLLRRPRQIAKLHVVPTDNNRALLHNVQKVILLRPAEEIVAAYWRGQETSTWTTMVREIARCNTLDQWQEVARSIGLTAELENFNSGWRSASSDALLITYEELTNNPEATIGKVLDYFGIKVEQLPTLGRVNYTRDGGRGTTAWKKLWFSGKWLWARVVD
jgi:LPS sulfotransferase NodH